MWSEEKKALEERKRIEQLRRERDEERQIQDLQQLQEDSGKSRQQNRVDWMYQAPSTATGQYAEEMEGYLLGKRRIDGILLKNEHQENAKPGGGSGVETFTNESSAALPAVTNSRDTMMKVMSDPLLEIKKREQNAYEAMVKEAQRRGQKLVIGDPAAAAASGSSSRDKDHDRDHDRHKRRRHNSDEDRSHRRHRHHRSHRHRSRSRSPLSPEDDSRHRSHRSRRDERDHRDDRDRDRRDRHRRDRTRRDDRDRRDYSRREDRDHYKSRDRGDERHRDSRERRRSTSRSPRPETNGRSRNYRDYPDNRGPRDFQPRRERSRDRQPNGHQANGGANGDAKKLEEDRARRLAEMQSNATDLEENRRERIAEVTAQEEEQHQRDEKGRSDRGRFVGQLHRQLQEDSLDERIKRSRGGLAVEKDEA